MTTPESSYAKPFLSVPEQIRRLRERGMDCGDDAYAYNILEKYGYYRLSGYWHLYRDRPAPPAPRFNDVGQEIRLDRFLPGTSLSHVVALYEFDHELRVRLGDALSIIETAFRFFIGHRLGRIDTFAHRDPEALGAVCEVKQCPLTYALDAITQSSPHPLVVPTTAYREWLEEYDRHERRARGDFVLHFREHYGPHLPIWVATEVMSFGLLSNLYKLMRQSDQEILAARFQVHSADGRGDRGALANWLNCLRNLRNICAHYGRVWNRAFDVLIDAPGQARRRTEDLLAPLVHNGVNNRLYGVLLVMRYLISSIDPDNGNVVDLVSYIEEQSRHLGFGMGQLGFPEDWRKNPLWDRGFEIYREPMVAASLLDRVDTLTAPQTREALTIAEPRPTAEPRTPEQWAAAKRAAQKDLLRAYRKHEVVIEIELGGLRYYPSFQFRDGKIIDALAEINKELLSSCTQLNRTDKARALLDWWQTPHPNLTKNASGCNQSPLHLLDQVPEAQFEAIVKESGAVKTFNPPA